MLKILPLVILLLLLTQTGYSQTNGGPDLSMTQEAFEKEALKPKKEVWVVDFWATWCGPCIESIPYMKQLQQRYASKGVRFISISWDESEIKWRQGLDRLRMPWQQMRVTKAQAAFFDLHFAHASIPTAFVIRADGKVKRSKGIGMLESAIQKALKAREA
jgi:thiol-disulfide isomerase/thioredoxin